MIKRFSVKNFKNFKEELVLDFSKVRDYGFNQSLIKNGLINKMLVFGKNNSGKSNLGAAIMDITTHLTENVGMDNKLYTYYVNGDCVKEEVSFKYEFLLNGKEITYMYKKGPNAELLLEELYEGRELLFRYNYKTNKYENNIKESKTVDISKRTNTRTSVLKFMYNNTLYWDDDSAVKMMIEFVNNMLWFRSLRSNEFIGIMSNGENLDDFIINNRLLKEFEAFLRECGAR